MTPSARDDFPSSVVDVLGRRVGFLCSNPGCRRPTSGPRADAEQSVNIGVAAHITAASPNGPRYDASLTRGERRSAVNGIWLCQNHGKLVDNDEQTFPVDLLRTWKKDAEDAAFRALLTMEGAQPGSDTSLLLSFVFHGRALTDQILRQSVPTGRPADPKASAIVLHSDLSGIDPYASRIVLASGAQLVPPHDAPLLAAEALAKIDSIYTAERWGFEPDDVLPVEQRGLDNIAPFSLTAVEQVFVTFAVDPDLVPDRQVATYLRRLVHFSDPLPYRTHGDLWWEHGSVGRRLLRRLRELGELAELAELIPVDDRREPGPRYATSTGDYRRFLLARAAVVDLDEEDWARHDALSRVVISDRSPLNDYWKGVLTRGPSASASG